MSFKLNVSLKVRGGVWLGAMLLHRHRAIVWYVFGLAWLVKFQGSGVVENFDVFLHSYAVCLCCLHASNDPQQAVKLLVLGLGFVEQCWLRLFLGHQLQLKMG